MAAKGEVTNELLLEHMRRMHARFDKVDASVAELKSERNNMRVAMLAIQGDIGSIYRTLGRRDERLDRIERRLDLHEMAEAGIPFLLDQYKTG